MLRRSLDGIVSSKRGNKESRAPDNDDSGTSIISFESATSQDLEQWAQQLEEGVEVKDRKYHWQTYKQCFVGSQAVDFLVKSGLAPSRCQAVELGREFVERLGLFEHICREHDFEDAYLFYRFVPKNKRLISIENLMEAMHNVEVENDESSVSSSTTASTVGEQGMDDVEEAFLRGIEVKDRRYHFQLYPECFVGTEAVSCLVSSGHARTREQAVLLGNRLMEDRNLFCHITNEHPFKDSYLFYRYTPENERTIAEQKEQLSFEEIAERFHRGVKVKDRKYRLKTYKDVFVGSKAVDWLIRHGMANSRREAVEIGRTMADEMNLFQHCTGDHPFQDDYLFYRFNPANEWHSMEVSDMEEPEDPKLTELANLFRRGVKVQTNRYRGKTYRKTFVGARAVDFLVNSSQASTRKEAVEIGRRLMKEMQLFDHVYKEHDFSDDYLFYRFSDDFPHRPSGMSRISGLSNLSSSSLSPEKMADAFRKGVVVKDRKYHWRTYKQVFIGSEAVDWLVGSNLAESRMEAVEIGRNLVREFNLFEHVTKDHEFKDAYLFYRMTNEDEIRPLSEIEVDGAKLLEMATLFEAGIEVKDNRHRLRVYHNSFIGKDAVTFLVKSGMAKPRSEAVQIGRLFAKEFNLLEHVTRDHLFSDDNLFFHFVSKNQRHAWFRDDSEHSTVRLLPELVVHSDDEDWVKQVKQFETRMLMKLQRKMNRGLSLNMDVDVAERLRCWVWQLRRLDPRYQILSFFRDIAQEGANNIEETMNYALTRPLLRYFPRASVFTVWRPTSFDAIRRMMLGEAVGKGLDIKGKSAKRGKLKAFVPFLQISENKHKRKVRALPKHGTIRLFFKSDSRRTSDIAAEKLEEVAMEMMETVKEARRLLADDSADEASHKDAMKSMLLDMGNPSIIYIDDYAPQCYGLEIPVRLLWEAYFVRQDCTRIPGSEYDLGRPSQPAFQDMNFAALRSKPKEGGPRTVLMQHADPDSPMNPFELLMAYEQNGHVLPVVSDFDCLLVGTRNVKYSCPLPPCQLEMLQKCVSRIETILDDSSPELENYNWTSRWLDLVKKNCERVKSHKTPMFGFGDPKSYSIMKSAVQRLEMIGAVRHGAESFNYDLPQELDDEFLIVSDNLPEGIPWKYVSEAGLQSFLSERIDQGFVFPLHVKWILCDPGWKELYDKLMASDRSNVLDAMNIWFPPGSGIREKIEDIHRRHPYGFIRGPSHPANHSLRHSGMMALAELALQDVKPKQEQILQSVNEEVDLCV